MDPYLHFENPSPRFPVVYQGLADDASLVLTYVFPQGHFCTGLSRGCTALCQGSAWVPLVLSWGQWKKGL